MKLDLYETTGCNYIKCKYLTYTSEICKRVFYHRVVCIAMKLTFIEIVSFQLVYFRNNKHLISGNITHTCFIYSLRTLLLKWAIAVK